MAESLRYQPTGVQFNVPQVDFAASKVQARALNELSANLDRMSSFFFKMVEQRAKIEGAEYGALPGPTSQQIQDAYGKGEEIQLGGDKFSIYGQSIRNAQLEIVANEIEYQAKTTMASIKSEFSAAIENYGLLTNDQKEQYSPNKFANEVNDVIAGYASTLDETSPGVARKLRALLGINANSKFTAYADDYYTKDKSFQNATVIAGITQKEAELHDTVNNMIANNIPTIPNLQKMREDIVGTLAINGMEKEIVPFATRWGSKVIKVAKSIVVDELLKVQNPYEIIDNIYSGDTTNLPNGIKEGLNILAHYGENRKEFARQVSSEIDDIEETKAANKETKIKENEEKINVTMSKAISFLGENKLDEAIELMQPFADDFLEGTAEELKEWAKILKTYKDNKRKGKFENNSKTVQRLTTRLYDPVNPLILEELNVVYAEGKDPSGQNLIDNDFYTSMAAKIVTLAKKQMKEAQEYIKQKTGYDPTINTDDDKGARKLVYHEIMAALMEAQKKAEISGESFSPWTVAGELWEKKGKVLIAEFKAENRRLALQRIETIMNHDTVKKLATPDDQDWLAGINDENLDDHMKRLITFLDQIDSSKFTWVNLKNSAVVKFNRVIEDQKGKEEDQEE